MVHCSTTLLLYFPKQNKPGWNTVKPENFFPIVFEIRSLSIKEFKSLFATKANKLVDNVGILGQIDMVKYMYIKRSLEGEINCK
jgi:hypothetical protein